MKPAKEWVKELGDVTEDQVEAIQLDAYQSAMQRAQEIADGALGYAHRQMAAAAENMP